MKRVLWKEQDSVQLVIPWKDGSGQQEIEKGYMSYVRSRSGFYYSRTKMWLLGLCLCYLLRLGMGDFSILSIEARVGLVIAVLVIPISRGTLLLMANLAVKKRRRDTEWDSRGHGNRKEWILLSE